MFLINHLQIILSTNQLTFAPAYALRFSRQDQQIIRNKTAFY